MVWMLQEGGRDMAKMPRRMDEPENDIEGRLLGLVEERGRRDAAEGTRGEMKREDTARKVSLVSRGRVREEEVKEEGDE